MADSIMELAIAGLVDRLAAMTDQSSAVLLKSAGRGWAIGQSFRENQLPAAQVIVLARRLVQGRQTNEFAKYRLLMGVLVFAAATKQPDKDKELNEVIARIENAVEMTRLGNVTGPAVCGEFDSANFANLPQGSRLLMVECLYANKRGDPYSQ